MAFFKWFVAPDPRRWFLAWLILGVPVNLIAAVSGDMNALGFYMMVGAVLFPIMLGWCIYRWLRRMGMSGVQAAATMIQHAHGHASRITSGGAQMGGGPSIAHRFHGEE